MHFYICYFYIHLFNLSIIWMFILLIISCSWLYRLLKGQKNLINIDLNKINIISTFGFANLHSINFITNMHFISFLIIVLAKIHIFCWVKNDTTLDVLQKHYNTIDHCVIKSLYEWLLFGTCIRWKKRIKRAIHSFDVCFLRSCGKSSILFYFQSLPLDLTFL